MVNQVLKEDSLLVDELHGQINDSLNNWIEHYLYSVRLFRSQPWMLDPTICINSDRDKLLVSVNSNISDSYDSMDQLTYLYGVNIEGKWYFFFGPVQFVNREKKDNGEYRAHTHKELHEKTIKNVYRGYLKRSDDGLYEINDAFFGNMGCTDSPRPGYCQCKSCDTFEDWVLYTVKENWQKRDRTDYQKIRQNEQKPPLKL